MMPEELIDFLFSENRPSDDNAAVYTLYLTVDTWHKEGRFDYTDAVLLYAHGVPDAWVTEHRLLALALLTITFVARHELTQRQPVLDRFKRLLGEPLFEGLE